NPAVGTAGIGDRLAPTCAWAPRFSLERRSEHRAHALPRAVHPRTGNHRLLTPARTLPRACVRLRRSRGAFELPRARVPRRPTPCRPTICLPIRRTSAPDLPLTTPSPFPPRRSAGLALEPVHEQPPRAHRVGNVGGSHPILGRGARQAPQPVRRGTQPARVLEKILVARELQPLGGHGDQPRLVREIVDELTARRRFPEPPGDRLFRRLAPRSLLNEERGEDTNEERAFAGHGNRIGLMNVVRRE